MKPVLDGVYFLIKNHEVIYVGQSKDIYRRISEHRTGTPKRKGPPKDFDTWEYFETESDEQKEVLEYFLIQLLKPKLNVDYFPRCSAIKAKSTLNSFAAEIGMHTDDAKKALNIGRILYRMLMPKLGNGMPDVLHLLFKYGLTEDEFAKGLLLLTKDD